MTDQVLRRIVPGETGTVREVPVRFPVAGRGTHVLTGRVVDGDQLLCDFQRAVNVGYASGWTWNYHAGLTPWVRNAPAWFDFHEYYFSLLAKAICYAAAREPPVRFASLSASDNGTLQAALLSGEPEDVTVAAQWTDGFGRVIGNALARVRVKIGSTRTRIAAPATPRLDGVRTNRVCGIRATRTRQTGSSPESAQGSGL